MSMSYGASPTAKAARRPPKYGNRPLDVIALDVSDAHRKLGK